MREQSQFGSSQSHLLEAPSEAIEHQLEFVPVYPRSPPPSVLHLWDFLCTPSFGGCGGRHLLSCASFTRCQKQKAGTTAYFPPLPSPPSPPSPPPPVYFPPFSPSPFLHLFDFPVPRPAVATTIAHRAQRAALPRGLPLAGRRRRGLRRRGAGGGGAELRRGGSEFAVGRSGLRLLFGGPAETRAMTPGSPGE